MYIRTFMTDIRRIECYLELSYSLFEDRALILEQTCTLLEDLRYIRTFQVILEQLATLLENLPSTHKQKTAAQY